MSFVFLGTGSSVPERIVTNDELSAMVDTSDEWISRRVGVRERRVCTTETAADLGYRAALNALEMANIGPGELDMIICATIGGEMITPSTACMVQMMLGATCPAMDINAACPGFLYALDTAAGFFARKKAEKVLVIGVERLSRYINWSDRGTCVIFGDGAGAVVLGAGDGYIASKLYAQGNDRFIRVTNYGGKSPFYENPVEEPLISMNGQETFRFAVGAMSGDLEDVISQSGLSKDEIDWVVPHQANIRIVEAAIQKSGIAPSKFCINIERFGNTSAASIPILLDEMNRAGKLKKGEYVAFVGFGGGLTSAACIVKWGC